MSGNLYNIVLTDYTGGPADLQFLETADWLQHAAVIANVYPRAGSWYINLVFAWTVQPMQFLCRRVPEEFTSREKAIRMAEFYRRTAQKDKRGSLEIKAHDFIINNN